MRIGRIVSYVVATCSFQALLACDPIEYASVVEIVPKTCDFWRYAGEVRSASEAADPKEVVKWSKDCGEPEEHLWRRLQFSQGSARFSIDTDVISKPDPDTISNLGSRVQFNMKGCDGKVESTAIEAIHRPLEADISNVAYLEYTLEGVNADWTVNVNRFSLASFQFDFISTTADEAFGDRLARATIGAADGSEGVFSASLCGKTFDPYKWKLEFFTSDLEIRRAIVGMVVTKAIRDDRRDGPSGEEVPSQCRATFLALSIGLPLLLSVLGATVLLLLLRRRRRRATTMPLEGVDVEEQTQTAILASLKAGRIETPHPNRSQDNGGGTGLSGKRGTAIAPWEAALDSHGNADRKGATAHAKAETLETASPETVSPNRKPLLASSLRKGKGHEAPRSPKKAAW